MYIHKISELINNKNFPILRLYSFLNLIVVTFKIIANLAVISYFREYII